MVEHHKPEVWLRGPLLGFPALVQPVAHSLLQSREEVHAILGPLTAAQIAERPGGAASIGYHLRHAVGSLDRLLTYARGEMLSEPQLESLAREGEEDTSLHVGQRLASGFDAAVDRALDQLRATPESSLREARVVGRAKLPSTVVGLLIHAAEHTQRHVGQATTTAKIVANR